ncbi:MAG: regulatory signaling modulator protein AmpE [Chromatiales bacterium]|jgi:membrane protein required for beta-lactamase induction
MSIFIIVICLIAERFLLDHQHLRQKPWLETFSKWLTDQRRPEWTKRGLMSLITVLLPPLLITALLQQLLAGSLFGLPSVIFAAAVLLYCLGPIDLDTQVNDYSQAAEADEEPQLRRLARDIIEDEPPTSEPALSQSVAESILLQANQRLFGVIFWFLLLGPLGALLYRMTTQLPRLEQANRDIDFFLNAKQLLLIMDWLPARLTAICYAIAGSFEDALYGWRSYRDRRYDEFSDSNSGTLICTGSGAMRLNTLLEEHSDELHDFSHLPQSAMALVWRSLVVWLVIAGLLALTGIV